MLDRYLLEKHFTRKRVNTDIKCFALFEEFHKIADSIIKQIDSSHSNNDQSMLEIWIERLYKCVLYENELVQSLDTNENFERSYVLAKTLDYFSQSSHLMKIYIEISMFFKDKRHEIRNEVISKAIFHHIQPLIKLFDVYKFHIFDLYQNYQQDPTTFLSQLKDNFLKSSKHGQQLFLYFKKSPKILIPKLEIAAFAKENNLQIHKGTNDFNLLIGEMVLANYILNEKPEDFLILFLMAQSIYSKSFLSPFS